VPFTIRLKDSLIQFKFENPRQHINLDITEKGYRLKEVTAGSNKEVPASMYSNGVRGTDMSYDDISMRYLYWPKKQKIGEEMIKTQRCYVVDLYNPQRLGAYYMVRIFVEKKSGGLMRLNTFDWNGKKIKDCIVTAGMKIDGKTLLKTMEVLHGEGIGNAKGVDAGRHGVSLEEDVIRQAGERAGHPVRAIAPDALVVRAGDERARGGGAGGDPCLEGAERAVVLRHHGRAEVHKVCERSGGSAGPHCLGAGVGDALPLIRNRQGGRGDDGVSGRGGGEREDEGGGGFADGGW
jgi:hypothetical protein